MPGVDDRKVSVLLPVHNPGEMLAPLAERILDEQSYPRELIELVVVDDASSDGAARALREQRAADDRLVVREAGFGHVDQSRNFARAGASGEVLAMTDHDCMPAHDWLERAVAQLTDHRIVAGRIAMSADDASIWALLDMTYHLDQERYVQEGNVATANVCVAAGDFDELGGLDENQASGGDFEFGQRAVDNGYELHFAADAVVAHPARTTRGEYLGKARRVGQAEGRNLKLNHTRAERALMLVPGISTLIRIVKRRSLKVLSEERLAAAGITPTTAQQIEALLLELFVVGPVLALGRWEGMR